MSVYITATGRHLPGPAIDNDHIESHLGFVNAKPSRLKKKILQSNGIKTRHYAIDDQQNTYITNQQMAANSAEQCIVKSGLSKKEITLLSCATSQGDLVLPGFGSMVQAELGLSDIELSTSHGICSCSLMALKNAFNSIKLQDHKAALVVASELSSRLFKSSRYEAANYQLDFNAEFLRWMLSDGAGSLLLESEPSAKSLRIDWIKSFSHADAYPVCMSVGQLPESDKTWQDYTTYAEAEACGALLLRQDVRLLDNIVKVGVDGYLRLIDQQLVVPEQVDHVLCHYSSDYFRSRIFEMLNRAGVGIAEEKWYTNLYDRGNTGCASLFIMLDEFIDTQTYATGETIFCMVPESGRFNTAYMQLTVV